MDIGDSQIIVQQMLSASQSIKKMLRNLVHESELKHKEEI